MKYQTKRRGFSLLELIFVIVILGIVASIGSELIARVYQQYIVQRAEHRASIKTELAALQIANRLASAITGTVYRKRKNAAGTEDWIEEITDNLGHPLQANQYNVLQWVEADMDSFNANSTPGWSGFCDVNNSSKNIINTPGSNLGLTNDIIGYLSGGTKTLADAALYFPYYNQEHNLSSATGTSIGENNITLDNVANRTVVEHYKLAWSSYALVCENGTPNFCGDLMLYYNFPPQSQIPIPPEGTNNTKKSLLLKNVTNFKFKGAGRTIRFKICKEEQISENINENITACKEKAVF